MHLEFLVEERSAEAALNLLVPKIVGHDISFQVHPHQGKHDLLSSLAGRLRGYRAWIPDDYRIVVLVDEDRQACEDLKAQLERIARTVGFVTRTTDPHRHQLVNRLCVEELEAWFIGDPQAVAAAFPRVSPTFSSRVRYRDPDAIAGGTWESLESLLQRAGYYRAGMPKIEVAKNISTHMDPVRNRSRSFTSFRDALLALIS